VKARRAACAALALAAGGCAGYGPGTPAGAGSAVSAFIDACARGRPELASELVTPLARRAFLDRGAGGCFAFLGIKAGTADELRRARVVRVTPEGAETLVTVTVQDADGSTHPVEVIGRGSLWQLTGVAPSTG
jgi:hypothetical protein